MTERARRPWTLRRRLLTGIVALLAVLGVVVGGVSVIALRASLMTKLDAQVSDSTTNILNADSHRVGGFGQGRTFVPQQGLGPGAIAASIVGNTVSGGLLGSGYDTTTSTEGQPPLTVEPFTQTQASQLAAVPTNGDVVTVNLEGLGGYRVSAVSLSSGAIVLVGLPLSQVTSTVTQVVVVVLIVLVLAIAIAVLVGLWVVRSALRPLERVAGTASAISELPLEERGVSLEMRVPEDDADPRTEVGQVGSAFNRMLGHISGALSAREASEQKLRTFVADASHELRTPLASIRGYAELTRRSGHELPEDVVHAIGRVESESVRMTSLVEDLLLLARLDDGRELESLPVDLSRILLDAVSDAHAAGQDHRWELDLPEEPLIVSGDEPRLRQVFVNLLANARVHTPAGTTVVTAASIRNADVVVTIVDNGPGIDERVLPSVFERFARGDSSRSRHAGSTGLGLAIVSAVVDAHGGTVSVSSEPGRTEFSVALPVAAAASVA